MAARRWAGLLVALLVAGLLGGVGTQAAGAVAAPKPTNADSVGEIEFLALNTPGDLWSGGSMVVGGQFIILPRNLLIDLPANRVTLQQLFKQAPEACQGTYESGLAKADKCNATGTGGIATVTANRTTAGNVIAGDLLIAKGQQVTSGTITYLDYADGYFRLNGIPGDDKTGVMVRLNDPTARHTVQQGKGCPTTGGKNCSPDTRFALDADNYTNTFSTGYPLCLPSTQPRDFADVLDTNNNGNTTETLTSKASPDGTGDTLCPDSNRPAGDLAADSRRFAPVQLGDSITVKGNFETVNNVRFLSAHSSTVSVALSTNGAPDQPDYVILNEMFIDAPGFYRERVRDLFIGATTEADSDVNIWTVHRDPNTNKAHEFPIGSVAGCELAAGALTCRRVLGPNTFRIRHDIDFLVGANSKLNPCTQLAADPRLAIDNLCAGGGSIGEQVGILSPLPHEVKLRTGHEMAAAAAGVTLHAVDVSGASATHGQYTFPMGVGLGGIELPAFAEINVGLLNNPHNFEGMPWTLDRRLSPNGCMGAGGCEADPQPLDPYPSSSIDPRTASTRAPNQPFTNPAYTASMLNAERDRMLSYVSRDPAVNNFDGQSTVLTCCPAQPAYQNIAETPTLNGTNLAPTANPDTAATATDTATNVDVLANDVANDDPIDPGSVSIETAPSHGTAVPDLATGVVTYTPSPGYTGTDQFRYQVKDNRALISNAAAVTVTIKPPPAPVPTISGFSPNTGLIGEPVTVTGTNLNGVTAVAFGGTPAASFTVASATQITAIPAGAGGGAVSVTAPGGTATTTATYVATPPKPTVTSVSPGSGVEGDPVTITGTDLATVSAVTINGARQTVFQSVSDTQIKTSVPIGTPNSTAPGPVSVTTDGGTAAGGSFKVDPPPPPVHEITSISPTSGPAGTVVTVNGTGLLGVAGVSFGGVPATLYSSGSSTSVSVTVPAGAATGPLVVQLNTGAVSGPTYTVLASQTAPDAPVAGAATAGNGSAGLTWATPPDGGSPITSYTVQAVRVSTGAVTATTVSAPAISATVTGLANGVAYQLRVQAANAIGAGGYSGLSATVKPGGTPSAPGIGVAAGGKTTDTVVTALAKWTAPASTGGSPIKQYSVTAVAAAGGKRTTKLVGPTVRSTSISGLVKGATYTFVVSAVNAIGTGASSAPSNSVIAR